MDALGVLAQQPVVHSVGWTLVHFLWQGAVLGGACAFALFMLRSASANLRYAVGVTTLLLMAVAPVATLLIVHGGQPWLLADADTAAPAWSFAVRATGGGESGFAATVAAALPWLVVAWFAGVMALAVRLCAGWWRIQRLRRNGTSPAPAWVQQMVGTLAVELRVPVRVQVLLSTLIDVPTVIGWLRPVILLPATVVTGLSPQQLEMVIAHELGHVRRFDYLVNLVQVVIGMLLFYHPAVRWVSERVRIEREHCCDDIVIAHTTDPVSYARALAALEAERHPHAGLVMAATGGSLLGRIHRLFGQPEFQYGRARVGWIAAIGAVVVFTVAFAATRPWWAGPEIGTDELEAVALADVQVEVPADEPPADERADEMIARPDTGALLADDAAPMPELSDRGLNEDMQRAAGSIATPTEMPRPEIRVAATLAPLPKPMPVAEPTPPRREAEPAPVVNQPQRDAADEREPEPEPIETAATTRGIGARVELVTRTLPDPLHTPTPDYPAAELRRGILGAVTASFVVQADGSVDEVEILGSVGGPAFDERVARTLREWKYEPPADGIPVTATRIFRFEPNDDQIAVRECSVTGSRLCRHRRTGLNGQRHNVQVIHFNAAAPRTMR